MEKKELLKRVGNIQQQAYLRLVRMEEGRAGGMKMYEIKNGPLEFKVMADKCLDLAELSYRGETISFLAKPGLLGRNHFDTNGAEAQRSIMGGMLFTCGLDNICAPCVCEGREYPMHGRIRTTPAEHLCADAFWDGDRYCMELSGEMRQAELFGENLVLKRKIKTCFPEKKIVITDEICNESFREEPYLLLYHFNIGYPMLSEDSELILPSKKTVPRDEASKKGMEKWMLGEAPLEQEQEYVFLHELSADFDGNTFAALINRRLGFGIKLSFNKTNLPYFMEWKSLASGDYVIGLEPANATVYGKEYHLHQGNHPVLSPFETVTNRLELTIIEEPEFETIINEKGALQ